MSNIGHDNETWGSIRLYSTAIINKIGVTDQGLTEAKWEGLCMRFSLKKVLIRSGNVRTFGALTLQIFHDVLPTAEASTVITYLPGGLILSAEGEETNNPDGAMLQVLGALTIAMHDIEYMECIEFIKDELI